MKEFHTNVMSLTEASEVPVNGGTQAEIVQHCRMKQMRQIAYCLDRPIRNGPGILEYPSGATGRLNSDLRERKLDLDGREHLADFIVKLAGDVATLFFLRSDLLR